MKLKLRIISLFLISAIFITTPGVYADINSEPQYEKSKITIDDIYMTSYQVIYTSEDIIFSGSKLRLSTVHPIFTRVQVIQSSSQGLIERDSIAGTYLNVATVILSFIPGVRVMILSQILSLVGLIAGDTNYVQSKTFTSYIQHVKNGQARWSNEANFSNWVISARRNHYKHVWGAVRQPNNQWITGTYDFLDTPVHVDKGVFFDNSNDWFREQARQRIQTRQVLFDIPW